MDWKSLAVTFALVFLAELGDKTQLATMMLAAETGSFAAVFLGSAAALVLSALVGAILGNVVGNAFPVHYLQTAAGIAFLLIGFLLLTGRV